MKRYLLFLLVAMTAVLTRAQQSVLPFETEESRAPRFQTNGNCLIRGAKILTVTKGTIPVGDILIQNGKIKAIGQNLDAPEGVKIIDARGKIAMPGIVDGHSHRASDSTNEGTDSITVDVRIGDVLNSTAKTVWQALASGHTTALILHGSANTMGGQSVVIKYKYRRPTSELPIPDAPRMVKFALGENVTRMASTNSTRFPKSRMGVEAVLRRAFDSAKKYMAEWDEYEAKRARGESAKPPRKDMRLEALADILRRKIWVQCHSYRADEILMMVRLSQEYGFKIGAMQHALEAYKIAPELAKAGVGVSIFADQWSFKLEGYDSIPFNAEICTKAGVTVSINTDGVSGTTALNIDAAKAMRYGGLTETQALSMITINPAKLLGIDHRTGSLEVGKDADIALWDGHPLSVYSRCVMTMIEGEVYFQRRDAFQTDPIAFTKATLDPILFNGTKPNVPLASSYAIVGADIYPASGPMIPGGTIVLEKGRITAIGKSVTIPAGAVRINGKGKRVYPGFIDAGTSMGLSEIAPIRWTVDSNEFGDMQPDLVAATAVQAASAHFPVARYNGVLTTLSRPSGGTIPGQASLLWTDGWTNEQLAFVPKAALILGLPAAGTGFEPINAGCCDDLMNGPNGELVPHNHPEDDEEVDLQGEPETDPLANIGKYIDQAKAYATSHRSAASPFDSQLEAMRPYVLGQKPMIVRCGNIASIRSAIAFGKKYNLKIVLAGAAESWKIAEEVAKSGFPVVLAPAGRSTLSANAPANDWDPYDTPYVAPGILARAGVKFCFMTEDNSGSNNIGIRAAQSVAYGLTMDQLLRALTLSAAEILGVGDELGSLETGKIATLFVCEGDPCDLTSNISYAFVAGRPVKLESKHTQLRERFLQRLQPGQLVDGGAERKP